MGVVVLPTEQPASSLEWAGEYLVDPVGGFRRWRTGDASPVDETGRSYGSLVDSLAVSPSGRHRVLYTRRGTKAILLDDRTLLRELNRSFAYAEDFDYPIALGRLPDGRSVLAHCPESIGRIRIEDVATGEVLAEQGEPGDSYFHSRLAFSPDGRHLLVNGWFWHPEATVEVHDVAAAFADPRALEVNLLRRRSDGAEAWRGEVVSACWLAADRIVVLEIPDTFEETAASKSRRGEARDKDSVPPYAGSTTLSVFGVDGTLHARNRVTVPPGLLAPCGDLVLNLHRYPTLLDPSTGRIVAEWPDLDGGNTTLCYGVNETRHPVFAYEASSRRFALAQPDHIAVLDIPSS
jgi:hypothetical protein